VSGGSYNYLCWTDDLPELLDRAGNLDEMSKRLAGLGYAADAARETEELLLLLRQFHNRAMARVERLSGVWKAVEWWDSGDWGEGRLREALAKYRGDSRARFIELFGDPEQRLRERGPARKDMPEELTFRLIGKTSVLPEDLSAVLAALPDGSVDPAVVGRLSAAVEVAQVMGAGGRPDDDLRRRLDEGADRG
jgi:hypothetical protein